MRETTHQTMGDLARIEECRHPRRALYLTNDGTVIQCRECGCRRNFSVQWAETTMAQKAGGTPDPMPEDRIYGPTFADLARMTRRLDFALRAMGKAFYKGDHTPAQESALEIAVDAANGYRTMSVDLQRWLDTLTMNFPEAEPM